MRKAYSGQGDGGCTQDYSGRRLRKDDCRVAAAGKLDSLLSAMDAARLLRKGAGRRQLEGVQRRLRQAGAEMAGADARRLAAPVSPADAALCARMTDALGEPPKDFVAFDTPEAVALNECRVRCRELEVALAPLLRAGKVSRSVFAYINRLSSLFFMLACRRTRRAKSAA